MPTAKEQATHLQATQADVQSQILANMMKDMIRSFCFNWGFFLVNIVIFLNVVSDDFFFYKVIESEATSIKDAVRELGREDMQIDYRPKLLFIVVQRGHHVRFVSDDPVKRDTSHPTVRLYVQE